jgi:uncharacterized Zn-binding protein involved in type VI secretion
MRGSPDVLVDDRAAVRQDDPLNSHGCAAHGSHKGKVKGGSSTVTLNDKPAARVGDEVDCGGALDTGSEHVLIGG